MELPNITKSTYGTASNALIMGQAGAFFEHGKIEQDAQELARRIRAEDKLARVFAAAPNNGAPQINPQFKEKKQMPSARIVRVFIADTNENLPLERRVIYKSEEKLTDLTDQELFFEANPAALLAEHNAFRTTVIDKALTKATGKESLLEPARIRDLKMVVVDVAAF